MKLYKLKMQSFRGHKYSEVYFDDNFTAIIGKNDVGKSSILEALEIFFNNDTVKIDVDDCNIHSTNQEIVIDVTFELNHYEYTVDTVPTDLRKEFLLDENRLTIRKKWSCSGKSITAASLKTFIIADYPIDLEPLITFKINDLKKELEKYSNIDQKNVNKTTSSSIRQAIYQSLKSPKIQKMEIPVDKEEGKKIWDALKLELPLFCLFQADRPNKDSDKEVQDPLKAITKTAISTLESELERIKDDIKKRAEELGHETLAKLHEMNPEIAKVLKPEMTHKPWESIFSFSFHADDGIPVNKRGSGVRRLIMLNYFRAEAERKSEGSRNVIYAIEEPETSQHPDWQLQLINSLIQLSSRNNVQVLITTHSPYLTKLMNLNALRFITRSTEGILVKNGGPEVIEEIIESLGMLPDLSEPKKDELKVVICLEGPTDVKFFNKVDHLYGVNLETDPRIMVITVGGSTVKDWVNRDCLRKMNKKEIHIYDKDEDQKYEEMVEILNQRPGVFATLTQSLSIESYYHPEEISKTIADAEDFFNTGENWQEIWAIKNIAKDLSSHLKSKTADGMNKNSIKKRLADYAAISVAQLTDLKVEEEVSSWFGKIKEFVET